MSSKKAKQNPWTGARGRVWHTPDGWRHFEVRDMHGRVVWTDATGYDAVGLATHLDIVAEVVAAVRRVEGIGHKLKPYKKVNKWLL